MEMSKKAKEIMSKYTLFAPIIKMHVKEEEEKLGRKFTRAERNKFMNSDRRRLRTKAAIFTAAILGMVGGVKTIKNALPEGQGQTKAVVEDVKNEENNVKNVKAASKENFLSDIKVEEPIIIDEEEQEYFDESQVGNQIIESILQDYNEKYNTNLFAMDLKYIKARPRWVYVDGDNYIYDIQEKTNLDTYTTEVKDIYMILDCNDQIIASIGNIDNKYVDVDAKLARLYGGKEYIPSKKRIAITKNKDGKLKTEDELENIYEGVKIAYEDRLKEKER